MAGAAAIILILVVMVGFIASMARPGDALYGVRRRMQDVRIALTFDDMAKANAYLANADSTLDDLEYARDNEMRSWYSPLTGSVTSDLASALATAPGESTSDRARGELTRLLDISPDIDADIDADILQSLKGLEYELIGAPPDE